MTSLLQYQIALSLLPHVGSVNARRLVAYMGSVEAVFESSLKELKTVPGFGDGLIKSLSGSRGEILELAAKEIEFMQHYRIRSFFYLEKNFPRRLAQCDDAPVILFMKGDVNLNFPKAISIVGTRKATDYGRELTDTLVKGLAENGQEVLIISGLAYGIDVAAHKAALKYGLPTLAVVGHGLDTIYPAPHAVVAKEMILKKGAVLSDFTSGSKIDPGNFLRRNRIIAGLADCTIVVESASKGGALVTADIANSYNRDVFAFPGRTGDVCSKGCNELIKQNKAGLIESASDLMAFMGWEANKQPRQQTLLIDLDELEKAIVQLLQKQDILTIDLISREVCVPVQKINSTLMNMEFKGIIKGLPGKRYKMMGKG